MNHTTTHAPPRLVIRRTVAAPPAQVYAAWTQPEQMKRWVGPGDVHAPEIETDIRHGGAYRIVMQKPDGERLVVRGVYRDVTPPERLSYTWSWEEDRPEDEVETLITVEFHAAAGGTELVLTQENFASVESRDNHQQGWTVCIEQLAQLVEARA